MQETDVTTLATANGHALVVGPNGIEIQPARENQVVLKESLSLTEMIDRRQQLVDLRNQIDGVLAELGGEIQIALMEQGMKTALGSNGCGIKLNAGRAAYEFEEAVYTHFKSRGLLHHFQSEPKVTKSKVETLLKQGVITQEDADLCWEHCLKSEGAFSISDYVPKETKEAFFAEARAVLDGRD